MVYHSHFFLHKADLSAGFKVLRKGMFCYAKSSTNCPDDASWSLHVVRLMIGGKIQNYRNILRRYIRDYGENEDINRAVQVLERAKRDVLKAQDKTELIGYEGMASNAYFEVLPILILNQKTDSHFMVAIVVLPRMR